jgi:Sulfite exporter TauE/SafE
MVNYVLVLALGLIAGSLSGIIGTGASIMLLPVLVFQFGPKQAVPIMAIAALMSNVAKVMAWWREVDWWAFVAYSITGIPAAALGAHTLLVLPSRVVDLALGLFFLMMIPGALAAHVGVMEAVATRGGRSGRPRRRSHPTHRHRRCRPWVIGCTARQKCGRSVIWKESTTPEDPARGTMRWLRSGGDPPKRGAAREDSCGLIPTGRRHALRRDRRERAGCFRFR